MNKTVREKPRQKIGGHVHWPLSVIDLHLFYIDNGRWKALFTYGLISAVAGGDFTLTNPHSSSHTIN